MPSSCNRLSIMVAGVGNLLMTDDGLGVHAVRELLRDPPDSVALLDAGTSALHAADVLREADRVLLVDAIRAGGAPGTVYIVENVLGAPAPRLLGSIHALGVVEALRLDDAAHAPSVTVVGAEPERVAYGMELSPTVRSALPAVVAAVRQVIDAWRAEDAA